MMALLISYLIIGLIFYIGTALDHYKQYKKEDFENKELMLLPVEVIAFMILWPFMIWVALYYDNRITKRGE